MTYARIALTEPEFKLMRALAVAARAEVFAKWCAAIDPAEKAFFSTRVDEYDAFIAAKFDRVQVADNSQAAEPDDDDDNDNDD